MNKLVKNLKVIAADMDKFHRQSQLLDRALAEARLKVPEEPGTEAYLADLKRLAGNAGVILTVLENQPELFFKKHTDNSTEIKFALQGTPSAIDSFWKAQTQLPRYSQVVQLNPARGRHRYRVKIYSIHIYDREIETEKLEPLKNYLWIWPLRQRVAQRAAERMKIDKELQKYSQIEHGVKLFAGKNRCLEAIMSMVAPKKETK